LPHLIWTGVALFALLGASSCRPAKDPKPKDADLPSARISALIPESVLAVVDSTPIVLGGFGSAAATDPNDSSRVYLLPDRGPNYDGSNGVKVFPVPDFAPQIAVIHWPRAGDARIERIIRLSSPAGAPLSGLPATPEGGAGEAAIDQRGRPLPNDGNGIDSEGLHAVRDGSFWVAEEYRPSILHLDATGRTLERLTPGGPNPGLPRVFARRRPNRGLEALTGDPDGRILVAALQGPLDNPEAAGRKSSIVRLLRLDTQTGTSAQYLYPLEAPSHLVSDLAWIDDERVLVIEHDGAFKDGDPPAVFKRVYRVDFAQATEVGDSLDRSTGLLIGGRTLEEMSEEERAEVGIRPVDKTLVVDLLGLGYPHDKPEGLVILGEREIGIVNDDDFGVTDGRGRLAPKQLPSGRSRDRVALWTVRLASPIR